jgi:hypothetical protein
MDARIDALESESRDTRATLARIDLTLVRIEERMATKADLSALAERVAGIEGRISQMPTTWNLVIIVLSVVFTVMGGTLGLFRLLRP